MIFVGFVRSPYSEVVSCEKLGVRRISGNHHLGSSSSIYDFEVIQAIQNTMNNHHC
jgi:hypothetical protein